MSETWRLEREIAELGTELYYLNEYVEELERTLNSLIEVLNERYECPDCKAPLIIESCRREGKVIFIDYYCPVCGDSFVVEIRGGST